MPSPTHAEQMVTALQASLLKAVGVDSASVGGNSVKYRADLERRLAYWKKQVAIEAGTFKRTRQIYMGAD